MAKSAFSTLAFVTAIALANTGFAFASIQTGAAIQPLETRKDAPSRVEGSVKLWGQYGRGNVVDAPVRYRTIGDSHTGMPTGK